MFTKEMIAPCGLNCALCKVALRAENPCPGCYGDDAKKSKYCATCKISHCEKLKSLNGGFCDTCESYPCSENVNMEIRYANAYPMVASPMGNLAVIRTEGVEALLEREQKRWICVDCGGVICVHTGLCSICGRQYTDKNKADKL